MTIPLRNLDDRKYDDLVKELQALIPRYAPEEWTDFNASDPGIMLVELLAWLTESQIYRVNRIPKEVYLTFFEWLVGFQWDKSQPDLTRQLDEARGMAYRVFSHPERLISREDFEKHILDRFGRPRDGCLPPQSSALTHAADWLRL